MTAATFVVVLFICGAIYIFALLGDDVPEEYENQGNEDEPQCDSKACVNAEWRDEN